MYLSHLEIRAFGHFRGFAAGPLRPGLVVVAGPNEAGKSTLRAAVRWALFGTPRGQKEHFAPAGIDREVLVGFAGEGAGEGRSVLLRSDARRDRRIVVRRGDGPELGQDGLASLLRGIDPGLHDAIFSFDLQSIAQVDQLQGERLHATLSLGASAGGGPNPAEVLAALDARIGALWRPRASTARLRVQDKALKEAKDALRVASREIGRRGELEGRIGELEEALREAEARREAAREDMARLRRHEEAREAFETLRRCGIAREALLPRHAFPPGAVVDVQAAREARAEAATRRKAASDAVETAESELRALGALPAVLGLEEELSEARIRLERDRASILALPELERELNEAADAERVARASLGAVTDADLDGLPLSAEVRAEALHHRDVTARLVEQAPARARAAELGLAEATATLRELEDEAEAATPRLGPEALAKLDAWLAGIDARRRDEARLAELTAELARPVPARPPGWPPIDAPHVAALREAARRWADAEAGHEALLATATAALEARERAATTAKEALVRAEEAAAALASSARDAATLRALLPEARRLPGLWAERGAVAGRLAALEREDTAARLHLGLPPSPAPTALEGVDAAAPVAQRVREAGQRRDAAEQTLRALRAGDDPGRIESTTDGPATDENTLRARRDAALRARAALDRGQVETAPTGGGPTRWTGPLLLVLIAVLAFATAAVLVAALSLAMAVALAVVAWRQRPRSASSETSPSAAPELLGRAGLPRDATRGDLEVALADIEQALAALASRASAQRELDLRRERREAAERSWAEADAAWRGALTDAGLPADLGTSLVEAWLDAARQRVQREAASAEGRAALARIDAAIGALDRRLSAALGAHVPSRGAAEEVASRLERALAEAERVEAAQRQAKADAGAAEKAGLEAAIEREAAASIPRVPAEVVAAFSAAAGAAGLTQRAPSADLLQKAEAAAEATIVDRMRLQLLDEQSTLTARLDADRRVARELLLEVGDEVEGGPMQEIALRRLREAESERRATQRGLLPRVEAARAAAAAARAELDVAAAELREMTRASEAFAAFRHRLGAPEGLEPAAAEPWLRSLETARLRAVATRTARARRDAALAAERGCLGAAAALARRLGRPEPSDATGAIAALEKLAAELDAARLARAQHEERSLVRAAAGERLRLSRGAEEAAEEALARALSAAGCRDEASFDARARALAEHEALDATAAPAIAELRALLGEGWRELAPTADAPPERLDAALEAADAARMAAEDECRALNTALAEARVSLRELTASADVPACALAAESARAALDETRRVYWRLVLARHLLAETFERFRRERQPEVIRRASAWLGEATRGAYVAVEADGAADALRFSLRDARGERHPADALSAGTAALVYLALRLALAVEQGIRTVALPIWVDDVLAHLDPEREEAAARMLLAAARATPETQLFVLSCRPSTVAAFERLDPAAQVLRIDRWAGRDAPAERTLSTGLAQPLLELDPSPRASASAPPEATASLDAARAALADADRPMAKADFLVALGLDNATWDALRPLLDAAPDIVATGRARGRRYALEAPPD